MRINDLRILNEMTRSQAIQIFASNGVNPSGLSVDQLKKAHRQLALKNHPDRGGDPETMKNINAAYDVLKGGSGGGDVRSTQNTRYEPKETPVWAMAGYSGGIKPNGHIFRNDYTDVNFIKKSIWELSGHSKDEWTIWGFDGHYFRGVTTVFGNEKVFPEMAKAMVTWQTKGANSYPIRAVFVSPKKNPQQLTLIWLDGKVHAPVILRHDSFNANPGNDQMFTRNLPNLLDKMANGDTGALEDHIV